MRTPKLPTGTALTARSMRSSRVARAVVLAAVTLLALTACRGPVSYEHSESMLGTAVSLTLYGDDETALAEVADEAFAAMREVDAALDAYAATGGIAAVNADPYVHSELPPEAGDILRFLDGAGVEDLFDPTLWGVSGLYGFGTDERVPSDEQLDAALGLASGVHYDEGFAGVVFSRPKGELPGGVGPPGLDLGGAAKGLALDRAQEVLLASEALDAALVSAGSSTLVIGGKPGGGPWRVGVEDPREPSTIVAVIEVDLAGDEREAVAISTSGDYQQYFEEGGVRYHHILDPETGRPARGVRSVTVASANGSSLAADVLSTALFVAGTQESVRRCETEGCALYLIDDEGRAHVVPGPDESVIRIEQIADPTS
jgi:thiamine biosynthesis lipoprotein